MTFGRTKRFAAIALVTVSFSAASQSPTGGSPAPIKVAVFPVLSTLPFAIADQGGFFAKHNLQIVRISVSSGPALVAATVSGSTDVGFAVPSSGVPVLRISDKVTVLDDVAVLTDVRLVVAARRVTPQMKEPFPANIRALKGLKIGVAALGGGTQTATLDAMKAAGLKPTDVTFIGVGGGPSRVAALSHGDVDGIVADPAAVLSVKAGGIDTVEVVNYSSKGSIGTSAPDALMSFDIANTAFQKKFPNELGRYCAAMKEARTWSLDPANLGKVAAILAKYLGIPRVEDAQAVWLATQKTVMSGMPENLWNSQPEWAIGGGPPPPYARSVSRCG